MRTHSKKRAKVSIPTPVSAGVSRGAVLTAVSGMLILSGCGTNQAVDKQVVAMAPTAASDQGAQQQEVSLSGHAEPVQQVSIFPPVSQTIKELLVQLGAYVQKGQPLADIDGGDLANRISQAGSQVKQSQVQAQMKTIQKQISVTQSKSAASSAADVEAAKSKVKDLEYSLAQAQQSWERIKNNQAVPQELTQASKIKDQLEQQLNAAKQQQDAAAVKVDQEQRRLQQQSGPNQTKSVDPSLQSALDAAKATVSQLEYAFADAQKNWQQLQSQFDLKSTHDAQLVEAATAKDQANYQLNAAKQTVDTLSAKADQDQQTADEISKLQQQLDQASSSLDAMTVQQAKSDLENLQNQVNNLQLLAPISGFITEPTGSTGTNGTIGLNAGASSKDPLLVIANLDQVYVKIDAPEAMIGKITLDQQATVTFPSIGKTFQGKVSYIGEMGDLTTMTYPVRILIDNQDHLIRGGMRAQVTLK